MKKRQGLPVLWFGIKRYFRELLFVTALLLSSFPGVIGVSRSNDGLSSPSPNHHRFQRQSREQRRLSDEWILRQRKKGADRKAPRITSTTLIHKGKGGCPCEDPQWCRLIADASPRDEQRPIVFGFSSGNSKGNAYSWTHIDTVAWASNDEIMCRAHQHGARALIAAPSFDLEPTGELNITKWVEEALMLVQSRYVDGIIFDYESPTSSEFCAEAQLYASLIHATKTVFNRYSLQVVTCVAWSPDGIDGRNYPTRVLAEASDYLYVMDYDTQSQILAGPCLASANAPYFGMVHGIQRYLQLGVEPSKLILGVPWYGYKYPCLGSMSSKINVRERYCRIPQVPFRGVNCSDAAGSEVAHGTILRIYYNQTPAKRKSDMERDDYMDAVFFNTLQDESTTENSNGGPVVTIMNQYWFDDAVSLQHKYEWTKSVKLGGVGPYTFDDLDPTGFPKESKDMWSALDTFRYLDDENQVAVATMLD